MDNAALKMTAVDSLTTIEYDLEVVRTIIGSFTYEYFDKIQEKTVENALIFYHDREKMAHYVEVISEYAFKALTEAKTALESIEEPKAKEIA